MTDANPGGELVRLQSAQAVLRDHFLKWQCRARQNAVRQAGGRPSAPMQPYVLLHGAELGQIVVLINKKDPQPHTAEFRHMVLRTQDPAERYDSALKKLAAEYFQRPEEFSDRMTALFGPQSHLAEQLPRRENVSWSSGSRDSITAFVVPSACSRNIRLISRLPIGTTVSSMPRCRRMLRCSHSGPTGRPPRPIPGRHSAT